MPLLAGPWKPREPPHRRQVCHQLAQGRRPGSTRSGGARKVEDEPRAARWRQIAAQDASTRAPVCRRQPTQPRTPIGWAAVNGYAISCAAPWLNGAPPVPTNQPRDHRANRRPGQRRRLGPGPRKGRRRSTRPTPRPPTRISARQPRWPNGDSARWGFVPPDSRRASRTLPNPTRRRTPPNAGPNRLCTSKCAGRHTGDETPALSCQLTARISCVADEPRPPCPTARR